MTQAHWHVLGAGAIGCLFAVGLHDAGCQVTLVLRQPSTPTVDLTLENDRHARTLSLPVCSAGEGGPVDHLLVTTKAYDVANAVASVVHRLAPNGQVLVMANGMGIAEEVAAACPGIKPYLGSTTEGAYRHDPGHIHHAGRGSTLIGRSGEATPPPWFETWRRATPDCRWENPIEPALWRKLAINCAINPLTALHGCRNGELLAQEHLRHQLDELCKEIGAVCEAAGYAGLAGALGADVAGVIRGTAANYSSMLQDLRNGRRTEIDYITGHLLRVARSHGIDTPASRTLFEDIKGLEKDA